MSKVLIVGLLKADVLLNLYNHANFLGSAWDHAPVMRIMSRMRGPGNPEIAAKFIDEGLQSGHLYFDYIDLGQGEVPLKVDLGGFDFDSTQYNEMHGENAAELVVEGMRNQMANSLSSDNGFSGFLGFLNKEILNKQSNAPLTEDNLTSSNDTQDNDIKSEKTRRKM